MLIVACGGCNGPARSSAEILIKARRFDVTETQILAGLLDDLSLSSQANADFTRVLPAAH